MLGFHFTVMVCHSIGKRSSFNEPLRQSHLAARSSGAITLSPALPVIANLTIRNGILTAGLAVLDQPHHFKKLDAVPTGHTWSRLT